MKRLCSGIFVVLLFSTFASSQANQSESKARHIPVVEDLVQLLQARPDLRAALEGAIRTADLKGLRDMDSFLIYLDGFVTFVPTVHEVPTALKLYYIVNQAPGDQLNRDESFSAWMKKLVEGLGPVPGYARVRLGHPFVCGTTELQHRRLLRGTERLAHFQPVLCA